MMDFGLGQHMLLTIVALCQLIEYCRLGREMIYVRDVCLLR